MPTIYHVVCFWCNNVWIFVSVEAITSIFRTAHSILSTSLTNDDFKEVISSQYSFPPGELDGVRAVPFRLTPNLAQLVTVLGVSGPLSATVSVTARVLAYPSYRVQAILKPILKDEIIAWMKVGFKGSNSLFSFFFYLLSIFI